MIPTIKIFKTAELLADAFAKELKEKIDRYAQNNEIFNIALSGGNTPIIIYNVICKKYKEKIKWKFVHFYWSDERCVSPVDKESNFGMTFKYLLSNLKIDAKQIHRIRGEENPEKEVQRYSEEIRENVKTINGIPSFDLIMLGMGTDGHVASIFPDSKSLIISENICEATVHPVTKQKRITMTGNLLNNAKEINFIITGENKSEIVYKILVKPDESKKFPALYIHPFNGELIWLLDEEAARLLNED